MRTESLAFTGHSGEPLRGLRCGPDGDSAQARVGVVLLSPPYSQSDALLARARPLVEAGFEVIAPDLFSRERAEGSTPAPSELPDRRALLDLDGALACLAQSPAVDEERLAVLGWGSGGTLAFLAGCHSDRPAAVVSLGGRLVRDELSALHPLQPLEMALNLGCPWLGVFGAADPALESGELAHAEEVLSQFARSFDIVVLPGSGSELFDASPDGELSGISRAASERTIRFLLESTSHSDS